MTPHRVAEHRLPLRVPILSIRDRWSRSSFRHSHGSHHHAHRHRTPKRIQLCEHVHWCTVRLLFSILAATEEGCVLTDIGLALDRFLIGFGLTFAASAAPLLISEIAYPSQRGQVTSMYNSMWYLGSIMYVLLCPQAHRALDPLLITPDISSAAWTVSFCFSARE